MSTHFSAIPPTFRRRTFVVSMLATLTLLVAFGAFSVVAQCLPGTSYSVTSSAPPATANWTQTIGLWNPSGGYPGCSVGDSATNTNFSPTTIIVNSTIPNPIANLNITCNGCIIDIQSGGSLVLAGTGSIASGAQIKVSGGILTIANGGSLTMQSGSTLDVTSGYVDVQAGGTLSLAGTSTFTSGSSTLFSAGTLNVTSTLDLLSGATLSLSGGDITGNGTVNACGPILVDTTGVLPVDPIFNVTSSSTGAQIINGTFALQGGGNGDAPFTISTGATLDFPNSSYNLTTNGVVSGAGTLSVSGGTLTINGVTNPDRFDLSAGALNGPGFLTVIKQFDWSGGTLSGSGGAQLAGTGTANFTGTGGDMTLSTRTLDIYGYVNFTATSFELYLNNSALLAIYGTFDFQDDGTIGAGSGSPGTVNVAPNGVLKKTGGANTGSVEAYATNTASVFVTSGTLQFSGGGVHSGSFYASSGTTLSFSTGSTTFDPSSSINADGTIEFTDSSFNDLGGTYDVNGETLITFGATVRVNSPATTNGFTLTHGASLIVNEDFTMTGDGTWSCGTIGNLAIIIAEGNAKKAATVSAFRTIPGGEFHIASGATLDIDASAGAPTLSNATITNNGTITYTATVIGGNFLTLQAGATILNDGMFDIKTDAPILDGAPIIIGFALPVTASATSPNTIDNAGTFQKSAGTGTTNIESAFTNSDTVNALSGTMNFTDSYTQTAGTTTLGPGDIQVVSTMQLSGGLLEGDGTITGDVQNDAEIAPGSGTTTGTINISGNYTQGTNGLLNEQIASATSFDQLAITGTATLQGTFKATLIGGYEPPNNTTFQMVTYGSESGVFAPEDLPTYPHGSFTSSYTPTAYVLTAVVTPSVADLSLAMSGPANVNASSALSYTIDVTNSGPDPTTGTITVVNTLPAGVTSASASGGPTWNCGAPTGGTITCTNTTVITQANQLAQLTVSMTSPSAGGSITNSATVTSSIDTNSANNSASVTTTVVAQADLSITKTGPGGVVAGQNVTYTITVTNSGPSAAASVVVSDPQPANLTWVSNTGDCVVNFPCGLGTINSGQTRTITATYSTSPSFSGNVTNTASITSSTADPDNGDLSASATTNVGAQANLNIVKTGPATTSPGQNVVYTVTVMNNGPSPAANTVVSDVTPVGLAFLSNSGACTTQYPCSLGTLASGQSATITSTYTVPNNYSGATITNTASVSSSVNDPDNSDNTSMVTTSVAQTTDLSINKSGPGTVGTGQNIVYTITVTNLGPAQAAGVTVTDSTPPGLTFVSNSGACNAAFPCNVGTLNASQTATITSTYNIPANYSGASVANTASVTSSATDSNTGNNSSTTTATIVASADLSIVKSGPASFTPGQNITYTVSVTNNSNLPAANTFVSDTTPAGLIFVGNSGGCSGPFPCALGTVNGGQTVIITSIYSVPGNYSGTTVTNTASVSSSTNDANTNNNSSTVTTPRAVLTASDIGVTKTGPATAAPGSVVNFTIRVFNLGPSAATNVVVSDLTPAGLTFLGTSGACTTAFPCTIASLTSQQSVTIFASYRVNAPLGTQIRNTANVNHPGTDPTTTNNQDSATITVGFTCPTAAPAPIAPAADVVIPSPVTFSWSSVPNATGYVVTIGHQGSAPMTLATSATSIIQGLAPGNYTWSVATKVETNCPAFVSRLVPFTVCGIPTTVPIISVVGQTATGQTYEVSWTPIEGINSYELQEASDSGFANLISTTIVPGTSKTFTKNVSQASAFHYRVRGRASCGTGEGAYSTPISIVVLPVPVFDGSGANVNVPNGSTRPVVFQLFVPGLEDGAHSFVATVDKPWLDVTPTSGIIQPEGITLLISADPSTLKNGTWTGTVLVIYGTTGVSAKANASATSSSKAFPVSISLVTPVSPVSLTQPAASAVVIPSVGHLPGFASTWRSDIRVANISSQSQKYQLTFNSGNGDPNTPLKKTTIDVEAGGTAALDDIVRNWYGIGSLADSSNGLLTLERLDGSGKPSNDPLGGSTVVSSRTYNTADQGTLGQFIPAIPFGNFIGRSGGTSPSILSLQQLTQSENFRTNLGIIEASGKPVSLTMSVFSSLGAKMLDLPLTLKGGEQQQLNSVLSTNGISLLNNGRVEVNVTSGDGKAMAYASVVDNRTNDPLLVTGSPLGGTGSTRFVLAGIADLNTPIASWRSDVRLFNSGAAPQNATLTFYPLGNAAASVTKTVTVNPGEVVGLDNVLQSVFGVSNAGGALHTTTSVTSPLIVTARTYDQTANGTRGQFIPAVTAAEAVGTNERSLNILQAEESVRYRTNLGIAEVTGKPAIAEVTVNLPDSRVSPRVQIPLAAFESLQLPILSSFGIGATYNARISVRVIEGEGRITAYGSVVDMKTQDPTYIPAQ